MKKTLLVLALVLAALTAFGVGTVFAQGTQPQGGGRGQQGQGLLESYMVAELAVKLNLSVDEINARIAAGETMYSIALSTGVKAEDFPALMTEVRGKALDAAVKNNVITQQQADWMKQRGAGMMGGTGTGICDGTQQGLRGQGRGMMGGRGQQVNP